MGDDVVKERRRADASRKRGELWKVGEERIKRCKQERRCEMCSEETRRRAVERKRRVESCGNEESRRAVARIRG